MVSFLVIEVGADHFVVSGCCGVAEIDSGEWFPASFRWIRDLAGCSLVFVLVEWEGDVGCR
jgi:hypothetical protein